MEPINKPQNGTGIGRGVPQIDSYEKVTGKLEFITDLKRAGMLYGKILRSDRPHANIVSIDTSKAEALPGVVAVVTAADTAQIKFGPIKDDWVILAKDRVRFIGEEIAAVAAVDELTALRAISLIDVEYEDLPAVFDPKRQWNPLRPKSTLNWSNTISHPISMWKRAPWTRRLRRPTSSLRKPSPRPGSIRDMWRPTPASPKWMAKAT